MLFTQEVKNERKSLGSIFLMLSILVFSLVHASPAQSDEGEIINGDLLEIGDVAVEGIPIGDGNCEFEDFLISTEANGEGATKWLSLALDDKCRLVVDARWTGDLEDGPSKVVDPLISLLKYQTEEIEESPASDQSTNEFASFSPDACKTSYQHVYMYGMGGSWDQLTHKWGTLTFCYNGSTATISFHSGTCQGSNPMWTWVVDSCTTTTVVPGPASTVRRSGRGNYHCSPVASQPCSWSNPDGYYHNLTETETGNGAGTSTCTYGFGGQIVSNVSRQILQGCN